MHNPHTLSTELNEKRGNHIQALGWQAQAYMLITHRLDILDFEQYQEM